MKATNKNILYTARIVTLAMLFQLLSSSIFALVSTPQETKNLLTVCTTQGYKQIWVNLESESNPESSVVSCPYCLFNHIELDAINTNLVRYLNSKDALTDRFLVTQDSLSPLLYAELLSIRGPPQYL